jgi:hypothetical protein
VDPGNLLLRLCKRNCGITEPDASWNALGDAALRRNHSSVGDFYMAHYANLPPHDNALAHARATGDTSLRYDHGIFSDYHVVRDLHEIIDLHTLLNPCPAKTRAIDRRVRADLDVVVDLDDAELLNFFLPAIDHFKTKTVRADDCPAVNDHARSDAASLTNRHEWVNETAGSDCRPVSDVASSADDCVVADIYSGLNDGMRLDRHALSKFRARINDRGGVNPGRKRDWLRREFQHDLLERLCGIRNANLRGIDRLGEIGRNKNCRRARFTEQPKIFSVSKEADFPRGRFRQRRRARDLQRRIADYIATGYGRYVSESKSHGLVKP